MMKVLATGMSPPQCGRKTQTGYEHVSDLWLKALCAGGAEVEHRRVEPNEPLDGYDIALVGLVPPNSIAARYLYTALDVINRAPKEGCGLVLYVDDWRYYAIMNGLRVMCRNPRRRLIETELFKNFWARDWAISDGWPRIVETLESLLHEPWPTTLIPAFTWGDYEKLPKLPASRVEVLDPSAFARMYDIPVVDDADRRRSWVMGTFSDQRQWITDLGLTWEHNYVGTRRSKAAGAVKEWELVASYGTSWGVLGAPYGHAGSGWWRNRFVYAAKAGAIMLADQREVEGLGPMYYLPPEKIESMDVEDLRAYADVQRGLIEDFTEPADAVTDRLTQIAAGAHELALSGVKTDGLIAQPELVS